MLENNNNSRYFLTKITIIKSGGTTSSQHPLAPRSQQMIKLAYGVLQKHPKKYSEKYAVIP